MIKAIIFDVGGILDSAHWKAGHYALMCRKLGLDIGVFEKARKKHIGLARIGKISTREFFKRMSKELNMGYDKLFNCWAGCKRKIMSKNKDVEKIIKKLHKNYKIGTLTNVIELHHKIRIEKRFYDIFDFNLCSCVEGYAKPDIRFYRLIFKKLKNIKPEEMIFVDDWPGAMAPAKKLGMNTIVFKNAKQLRRDLIKLGVKV